MKNILLVIVCMSLMTLHASARIRNGYEPELNATLQSLQSLRSMLKGTVELTIDQRWTISNRVKNLEEFVAHHRLTAESLLQFKSISPLIYDELDNMQDKKSRETDIYVRLIPRENAHAALLGASFFKQSPADEDACTSRFGDYSVTIDVWITDNSLFLLAHELGHARYIIPNLAQYTQFYQRFYKQSLAWDYVGHCPSDESGKMANKFGKQFHAERLAYAKTMGRRPERPASMLAQIKGVMRRMDKQQSDQQVASGTSE